MASDTPLIPGARYVKVGGSNNGDSLYDSFVPCFTAGTRIVTPMGERRAEDLRVGDRVVTRDNGLQEIRWIGAATLTGAALRADRSLQPVLIRAGALDNGLPVRDLAFSPNHRVLLVEPENALLFGESEVLAASKDLVARAGVSRVLPERVTYLHLMFDQHGTVLSNGAWSESFLPGDLALRGLGRAQQDEIYRLFPGLRDGSEARALRPARRILRRHEVAAEV